MQEQTIDTRKGSRLGRSEGPGWGGTIFLGLLWTILGVLCLASVAVASVAAVYYVGILLAVGGIVSIVAGFRGDGGGAVILGILSLVVGVLMIIYPGAGLQSLTLLLIGYFFISGLFWVVTSLADRLPGWGYGLVSGLCSIAIGVYAVRSWPISNFWLAGTLIGVELIVRGVFMMVGAASARRVVRDIRSAA